MSYTINNYRSSGYTADSVVLCVKLHVDVHNYGAPMRPSAVNRLQARYAAARALRSSNACGIDGPSTTNLHSRD